jgi:hypothetical protein
MSLQVKGRLRRFEKNICEVAHNMGLSQSRRLTAPARLVSFRRQLVHRRDLNSIFYSANSVQSSRRVVAIGMSHCVVNVGTWKRSKPMRPLSVLAFKIGTKLTSGMWDTL